ncbi:hypothetical protein MCOR27_007941 [Pyricularia oryzae]|uniref:Tim10-like domain-containing protein n=1 Tax=Pyricularia oryzae TaxID=318829 RepID=A0A4P7N4Z3_PYROR|nr:hypothetical protein MCOR27_007941 [Pyricularia oryzae]KAI6605369.1 hypothetical protein MCOR04_001176 [Pyricularia oryzae]QBZ55040.1 hypothetical protein PoMZ_10756 [Pyricularia oryzae]
MRVSNVLNLALLALASTTFATRTQDMQARPKQSTAEMMQSRAYNLYLTCLNDCHSFEGEANPTALERCLRGCKADYDKAGEAWSRPSSRSGSSSGSRRHSSAGERGESKSSSKKNSKSGSSRSYKRSIRP